MDTVVLEEVAFVGCVEQGAAMDGRSPFLQGALGWLWGTDPPERCPVCGYDWSVTIDAALTAIEDAVRRYGELLQGRDGMVPAADGGWNATAYVWHLVDLSRSWSERWVQIRQEPGARLVGWDPDVLADARGYRAMPTASALWAFGEAAATFVSLTRSLDPATPFLHGDWGPGTVADGTRWIAHEYAHHLIDVDERVAR